MMAKHRNIWMLCFLTSAIIALMLLASGLSGVQFSPGRPFPFALIRDWLLEAFRAPPRVASSPAGGSRLPLIIIVWVLLPILLIYILVSRELRREVFRRILTWLIILSIFYVVITALRRGGEADEGPPAGLGPRLPPAELPTPPQFISNPPPWLAPAISLAIAAVVLAIAWFAWRHFRRQPEASPAVLLAQEAQEALEEVRGGGDVRDAVMRCYLEMSRILGAQRGVERQTNMTPREFERQLAAVGLRDDHIRRLTRLFESVRYGGKQAGEREEREAVDLLAAIAQSYGRPA